MPKAAAVADQRVRAAVPTVAVVFRMSIVVLFTGRLRVGGWIQKCARGRLDKRRSVLLLTG